MRPHTLNQALEIEPEVPAPLSLMEPVVQVETVHVGDDGGHGAPRNILWRSLVILFATPPVL
jgi:hypothetical protein